MIIKRFFDIVLSLGLLLLFFFPILAMALVIKITSKGPVFYVSDRAGRHNKIFRMYKLRTMKIGTPPVATHLLKSPPQHLTRIGNFLRKISLDELPQLFNILKGDMTFVGPRPALYNQYDLIELRTKKGIHRLVPGLTGWAQIHGRDELSISVKVDYDEYYLKNRTFLLDLRIIYITFSKVLKRKGVDH